MAGGVHGRGHAWGACVAGGMHSRGHVWQGGHAWQGACIAGGHAWKGGIHDRRWGETATAVDGTHPTGMQSYLQKEKSS